MSATSSSQVPSTSATGMATAEATSTVGGLSILGGFISIGTITSTATATSDGTTGKVTGTTQVQNVSIAGEPISITANGIQVLTEQGPAFPIAALNTLLKELGVTIAVTNPTDKVNGASASRELDGLEIQVNLDTLDTAANKFASLLPAKLVAELPVAIPNEQLITLYLGRVQVNSTALALVHQLGQHRQHGRRHHVGREQRGRPGPRAAASPATPASGRPPAASPATPGRARARRPRARAAARAAPRRAACPRRPRRSVRRSRGSAPR